jgi:hypothetical protein
MSLLNYVSLNDKFNEIINVAEYFVNIIVLNWTRSTSINTMTKLRNQRSRNMRWVYGGLDYYFLSMLIQAVGRNHPSVWRLSAAFCREEIDCRMKPSWTHEVTNVCTYVCMYVCMYVIVYICMHACMHVGMYVGNSISKLQIQVATFVFELSAGNYHH